MVAAMAKPGSVRRPHELSEEQLDALATLLADKALFIEELVATKLIDRDDEGRVLRETLLNALHGAVCHLDERQMATKGGAGKGSAATAR